MSLKMGNDNGYEGPNKLCPRCNIPLNLGMTVHNLTKNCEERPTFPYMEIGKSMHLECYIQKVIDDYFEQSRAKK